jgi:hypothetical protein
MAIIKIGAPLSGIRGTVGGITFSANKAGPYAKIWKPSTVPQTLPQAKSQAEFADEANHWPYITQTQRDDWDAFAADPSQVQTNSLGEQYYLSGFQWFCKAHARLRKIDAARYDDAPVAGYPAPPTIDEFRVCVAGSESTLCTGGDGTGSTQEAGHEYGKAFDGNVATYWQATTGLTTGWIGYDFAAPVTVLKYSIYFTYPTPGSQPRDWTFEVYSGAAWHVLQTVTDWATTAAGWQDFYVVNPYQSTFYKIDITHNQGSPTACRVYELEMYAGLVGASCICYPFAEFEEPYFVYAVGNIAMANSPVQLVKHSGYREVVASKNMPLAGLNIQSDLEAAFGTILETRSWFLRLQRCSEEGLSSAAAEARCNTTEAP